MFFCSLCTSMLLPGADAVLLSLRNLFRSSLGAVRVTETRRDSWITTLSSTLCGSESSESSGIVVWSWWFEAAAELSMWLWWWPLTDFVEWKGLGVYCDVYGIIIWIIFKIGNQINICVWWEKIWYGIYLYLVISIRICQLELDLLYNNANLVMFFHSLF